MSLRPAVHEALGKIMNQRWTDDGYGKFRCRSCGARRMVDYGDHEQETTETREACSRSCPWRIVEEWHQSMDVEI